MTPRITWAWMRSPVPAARSSSPATIPSPTGKKRHCPNRRTPRFPPRWIAPLSPMATCCNPTRPACSSCATTSAWTPAPISRTTATSKSASSTSSPAIMKLVKDAYAKVPGVQWAMYERVYGGPDHYFIYVTPMKSAAHIDENFANGPKFDEAIGKDGMKKLNNLLAEAVDQDEVNLFALNPAISYVGPETIKGDPTFWKPAPAAEPKKKAAKAAQ